MVLLRQFARAARTGSSHGQFARGSTAHRNVLAMPVDQALQRDLATVLADAAQELGVPGAAAGIVTGDDLATAVHGVTSVEHPLAVGPDTLFQVGSITKTFTSAAVLLLTEEGRLTLDDPVARFLPDLGRATGLDLEAITLEHTLSHQAGFDGDHLFVRRGEGGLDALADARRLFPPGGGFSYNNAAFSIAGAVVEAVAGCDFDTFVRERLLVPLGMSSATFRADDAITHSSAMPHWVHRGDAHVLRGAGWQPGWELRPVDWAAGGLIASLDHLLTWCRFQQTGAAPDGTRLLSAGSLARMHAPVVNVDLVEDVGLDWFVRRIDGAVAIGHGGVTVGYVSDLVVVLARDFGFVGLTNATNGGGLNQTVRRWALARVLGVDERDPVPDPARVPELGRWKGRYLSPFGVLTVGPGTEPGTISITTSRRDDVDGWQPPPEPPMTAAPFAADQVVTLDAPGPARVARFGGDRDGRAEWMLWGSRRALRIA
jgi:CubicO group peptidase (beta-lactamase class C family)